MKNNKPWLPLVILFVVLNGFFITGKNFLNREGFSHEVLLGGNLVLFAATFLSFYISQKSIVSTNVNSSVRSLYGSFMAKFFLIAIAAFVYIMTAKKEINKPSLYICMGLYVVYTVVEVVTLQKLLQQNRRQAKPPVE